MLSFQSRFISFFPGLLFFCRWNQPLNFQRGVFRKKKNPETKKSQRKAWANEFTVGTWNLSLGPGNPESFPMEVEGCQGFGCGGRGRWDFSCFGGNLLKS